MITVWLSAFPDISGSPVSVDVGMCRPHCGGAARPLHEAAQKDYSQHSSMLEFIRSKKVRHLHYLSTPHGGIRVVYVPYFCEV